MFRIDDSVKHRNVFFSLMFVNVKTPILYLSKTTQEKHSPK